MTTMTYLFGPPSQRGAIPLPHLLVEERVTVEDFWEFTRFVIGRPLLDHTAIVVDDFVVEPNSRF